MVRSPSTTFSALAPLVISAVAFGQNIGPSTSTSPYVLPSRPGVNTTSILTVGDNVGGYRMVGIPDGLGALSESESSVTLLMNHELSATVGAVRAHGQTGAFVSRWTIDAGTLAVTSGRDHNTSPADAFEFTAGSGWSNAPSPAQRWSRFCSACPGSP